MIAHLQYLKYLIRHKWFVLVECYHSGAPWLGVIHDLSKFSPSEWHPYVLSFYGRWKYSERPTWLVDAFDVAWLHHQKHNKHHWQYWILVQDEDEDKILPIPDKYRREMLADWRGASRAITNKDDTKDWYLNNRHKIKLHPETQAWIESQLCAP